MKRDLVLFFKMDLLTRFMDKFDLTDGSRKIFCNILQMSVETTTSDWYLSPAVVEVLEENLAEKVSQKLSPTDNPCLCAILDMSREVFYNFTNPEEKITMFSDGRRFTYFNTQEDMKKAKYMDAYKKFVFNDKQAKNDKFVHAIAGWMKNAGKEETCNS